MTPKITPATPKRNSLSESSVIDAITHRFPCSDPRLLVGLGDDAAVVRPRDWVDSARRLNSADQVYTTDLLIEGVHFHLRYMTLAEVGYKALAVNLSDIAAMGAVPRYALGNLGVPRGATSSDVDAMLDGVAEAANSCGVALIGGDTVAAPQWVLGFTVAGEVQGAPLTRNGAQPGDVLWHTGALGLSQTGLHLLWGGAPDIPPGLRQAHTHPIPQLAFAQALQRERLASAGLDLSDSLAQCALQLASGSGVGLKLDFTDYLFNEAVLGFLADFTSRPRIPGPSITIPARFNPQHRRLQFRSRAEYLLASAEEYQLLFTTPAEAELRLRKLARSQGTVLEKLGTVVPAQAGCSVLDEAGQAFPLLRLGFEHLAV